VVNKIGHLLRGRLILLITPVITVGLHSLLLPLIITVKHNVYTIWWIRTSIVNNLFQVSVNIDITKTTTHCTTYNLFKLNPLRRKLFNNEADQIQYILQIILNFCHQQKYLRAE